MPGQRMFIRHGYRPSFAGLGAGSWPQVVPTLAFADDLTLVLRCMRTLLPAILALLEVWVSVSGLHLQTVKCEVVPLVVGRLDVFVRALVEMGGRAADLKVRTSSRCLGVMLGPDVAVTQWATVAGKILPRTADVLATATGMVGRLVMFRTHIRSMVLFKAQFVVVPPFITALLSRSLQRLAAAPWMTIPVRLMEAFGELRFPAQAPRVENVARVALVRCAMAHRAEVVRARGMIECALRDDDAPLVPLMRDFRDNAIVAKWEEAVLSFEADFPSTLR